MGNNETENNANQSTTSEAVPEKKKRKKRRVRGKRGEGLRIKGRKEKFKRAYPGQDARVVIHRGPVPDPEETKTKPKDEAAKHKYPPPKKDPQFRKFWMKHIDNITRRENFKIGHLDMLAIFCDLNVTYLELQAFIRKNGRSYETDGRNGKMFKFYPEVGELNRVVTQIKDYTRMLSLMPGKDNTPGDGGEGEDDDWA